MSNDSFPQEPLGADDPRRGPEIFGPENGPLEAPAKEIEIGPYFKEIEERDLDLAATESDPISAQADDSDPAGLDRRRMLKWFSASGAAAATACIRRPEEKARPFVNQDPDTATGQARHFASTCGECSGGCGIRVKTRGGRPSLVEGLDGHIVNDGGLCPLGTASVQGLYHPERRQAPEIRFGNKLNRVSWDDLYTHLGDAVKNAKSVAIITGGATGHRHGFLREFLTRLGSRRDRLYTIDSDYTTEATIAAHQIAYGISAMPRADLAATQLVVGIGAAFLDGGSSRTYMQRGFSAGHGFEKGHKGRFVQFESVMTQTGGAADERHVIPPNSELETALLLLRSIAENKNARANANTLAIVRRILSSQQGLDGAYTRLGVDRGVFDKLANDLLNAKATVLAGGSAAFDENATSLQLAAIMCNELIGAYNEVLHLRSEWMIPPVVPGDLQRFAQDAAEIDLLIAIDCDPEFSTPPSWGMTETLKKIPTIASIQSFPNSLDAIAKYALPGHHPLESWGDEQPFAGVWSSRQPAVRPMTDSRQAEDILLWTAAAAGRSMPFRDYRDYLEKKMRSILRAFGGTDKSYPQYLRRGYFKATSVQGVGGLRDISSKFVAKAYQKPGLRLVASLDSRLQDGRGAHLPILQEVGDPLTTITWDSWVAMSPSRAKSLGVKRNDVVTVAGPGGKFEAAVYPMPGMHDDAIQVPRGNGHVNAGTIESGVGINPLVALSRRFDPVTGAPSTSGEEITVAKTGRRYRLAAMQKHNDIANRTDIVKKVSLSKARSRLNKTVNVDDVPDLYPELPSDRYRWGLSVDLDRCTGCGSCMVACALENNVPQVGREQILLGREMHWIRLDRYFGDQADNPSVTFQPMMCQQCNHAPCEAVCPVFATNHDSEGINAMTYNRCVGTRYCANACPYKVRRFNWWTHKWNVIGESERDRNPRALNPDVTVRTRGVMEKCNFCYQRIREARHEAKLANQGVTDKSMKTACQQACPAGAITFGNLNDPTSKAAQQRRDARSYLALNGDPEHKHYGIKTLPNVNYLAKVTHKESEGGHG